MAKEGIKRWGVRDSESDRFQFIMEMDCRDLYLTEEITKAFNSTMNPTLDDDVILEIMAGMVRSIRKERENIENHG